LGGIEIRGHETVALAIVSSITSMRSYSSFSVNPDFV